MKRLFILFFAYFLPHLIFSQTTIKILTIGNSFSEDAVENYLYDLGKNKNITFVIGNLYIGSSSLETHWNNAQNNSPAYSYRKINALGVKNTTANTTLVQAITSESWDYISFQQNSGNSGFVTTYFPFLTDLMDYVEQHASNDKLQYVFHQTWAYASNSTHGEFVKYDKNQIKMYNAIIGAVNEATAQVGINIIVPSGTAIQNARTSVLGDTFNRDGYHLNLGKGRFTAACTWYEKITGLSVLENSFVPGNVTATEAEIAKKAAHFAVAQPQSITAIEVETSQPIALKVPVKIDFGAEMSNSNLWNYFTSFTDGSTLSGLKDTLGNETGIIIAVNGGFAGVNVAGATFTDTYFDMPSEVSKDCFWSEAMGTFSSVARPKSGFKITGLYPNDNYTFTFFGSRMSSTDNRETKYVVQGTTQDSVVLDVSNNTKNLVAIKGVMPCTDGSVLIDIKPGENNDNAHKFYYINALQLSPDNKTNVAKNTMVTQPNVFPNPFNSSIRIESMSEISKIIVFDSLGATILSRDLLPAKQHQLQLENVPIGYFLMKIFDSYGNFSTVPIFKK